MSDWSGLRKHTAARIGLPRAGAALGTKELLAFQLAHARARDAVWHAWDIDACAALLQERGVPQLRAASCAADRASYLRHPELGRRLSEPSRLRLIAAREDPPADVALMLSEGLSATAAHAHGLATVLEIRAALARANLRCSPVVLVEKARVAISDDVGQALAARSSVIVLGERPGLSAADSLGIYLTHGPKAGKSDADRNCISNVRSPGGLPPALAAQRLASLVQRALTLGLSGVALKDDDSFYLTQPA